MKTYEPTDELRRNLYEDEELLWVARPHPLARALSKVNSPTVLSSASRVAIGTGIAITVLGAAVALLFRAQQAGGPVQPATGRLTAREVVETLAGVLPVGLLVVVALVVAFVLLAIADRLVLGPLLTWRFGRFEYAATNYRLIIYGGVFGRIMTSVPLEGVQDAEYEVSFLERLFDVGTVTLDTDWGYRALAFRFVPEYAEFTQAVTNLTTGSDGGPEAEPASTREADEPTAYSPDPALDTNEPSDALTESLYPGEELQWVVRPSRRSRSLSHVLDVLGRATAVGVVLAVVAAVVVSGVLGLAPVALPVVGVLVGVYSLAVGSVLAWHRYVTVEYAATDLRLIKHQTYLGRDLRAARFEGIHDAGYSVDAFGRLFDVGDVFIDSYQGYRSLWFPHVRNPAAFAREVTRLAGSDVVSRDQPRLRETEGTSEVRVGEPSEGLRGNIHDDESLRLVVRPHPVGYLRNLLPRTEYAVTDQRVIRYSGVFSRELVSVPLDGIHDAEYSIDLVGRVLDFGDVRLDTDWEHGTFTLQGVPAAAAVAAEITRAASAASPPSDADPPRTASAGGEPVDDVAE